MPETHWVDAGNPCHIERHYRTVGYYNVVRVSSFGRFIDCGGHPLKGLVSRLCPKDKPVWVAEEPLDSPLEIDRPWKEGNIASMVLLQALLDPYRNPEYTGDYLGGLDRFGLPAGPDHAGVEIAESNGQQFGQATACFTESPIRGRSISGFE